MDVVSTRGAASHESDVSKERSHMEVDLVRRAPRPVALIREHCWTSDCAEKVHPPFCSLGRAGVDIEEAQWDLDVGDPQLVGIVESCASSDTICSYIGDIETIERSTGHPRLRRVVY
jgi:hypothetical protein